MNTATSLGQTLSTSMDTISRGITDTVKDFSKVNTVQASTEFMQSNSIIAKFAFIILVILGFIFTLNLGMMAVGYMFTADSNPYLVKGMLSGNNGIVISQDPNRSDSVTLLRSNNQSTGIEFTWSVWLNVSDPGSTAVIQFQNIFNKGNGTYNSLASLISSITPADRATALAAVGITATAQTPATSTTLATTRYSMDIQSNLNPLVNSTINTALTNGTSASDLTTQAINALNIPPETQLQRGILNTGLASVNNGPGLYLVSGSKNSSIMVVMDTVDTLLPTQTLKVKDVPINKWFHVAIRMENTMLDIYVNGTIAARQMLAAVPKQNYNDVNVCQNGGFSGNLSNLRYFSTALSASNINTIVRDGPNVTPATQSAQASAVKSPYYISDSWFYDKLKTVY